VGDAVTRYANKTTVPIEKSRAEIEAILRRYGADAFAYMATPDKAAIGFRVGGRQIRFVLPIPAKEDYRTYTQRGWKYSRTDGGMETAWEQACRQRWRALALAIKAKLEAVESRIATFEDEFLAYVVLPSGETMGEWARPRLDQAIETGQPLPPLLPHFTDG
jgi:hypothetical protein